MLVPDERGGLVPMSHYPPLYPAVLAEVEKVSGDVLPAARVLDLFLFPLNVLLLAELARRMGLAAGATLVVCTLFLLMPDIMMSYASVRSETLVITWWLLGLALLWEYHNNESWVWLVVAAITQPGRPYPLCWCFAGDGGRDIYFDRHTRRVGAQIIPQCGLCAVGHDAAGHLDFEPCQRPRHG